MQDGFEICAAAQEKLWSASGLTYPKALLLIEALNAAGCDSNITVGGIAIYTQGHQDEMKKICKEHGAYVQRGYTRMQESVILRAEMVREPLEDPGVKSTPESRLLARFKDRKFRAWIRKAKNKIRRRAKRKQHRRT